MAAVVVGAFFFSRSKDISTPTAAPSSIESDKAMASRFAPLLGRWVRPDGGYVLEIKSVKEDGAAEAAYFNPSPIRVARARASEDKGALQLFVELRDAGYPGCTYKLTCRNGERRLVGSYFQAAMQESYEIFFVPEQ